MFTRKKLQIGNISYPVAVTELAPPDFVTATGRILNSTPPMEFLCYCKVCEHREIIDLTLVPETEIAKCPHGDDVLYWDTNVYDTDGRLEQTYSSVARGMKRVENPFTPVGEPLGTSLLDAMVLNEFTKKIIATIHGIPVDVLYPEIGNPNARGGV